MKKIDMHCHILPGIDDGSANPKETLAMLRMGIESGLCRYDRNATWLSP